MRHRLWTAPIARLPTTSQAHPERVEGRPTVPPMLFESAYRHLGHFLAELVQFRRCG
jgi:hypothetical protein